jgi:hypothetical protein
MHHTQNVRSLVRTALLSLYAAGVVGCLYGSTANAQTRNPMFPGPPIVGGTPGLTLSNQNNGDSDKFSYGYDRPDQHKNPSGQACVMVHAIAQPQMVNPKIFDHILVMENGCNSPIGLNLCYYQSKTCIHTTITAYSRRQQVLGISPEGSFRFSYTEDFN